MTTTAQRFALASRPVGEPSRDNFRLEKIEVPEPAPGQVLLRARYLSLDPYVRGRISGVRSYAEPTPIGSAPPGDAVSVVIKSQDPSLSVGDVVLADTGWQTYALAEARAVRKLDPAIAPVTTALGVLGMPGLTAYSGLLTIGRPVPGETVVVAAATGPVGSLVGQLAKIKGARAVGIAGGPEKTEYLRSTLGFDAAVDHRAADFADQLAAATPGGIDVYFENVGGAVFNAVFPLLNTYARVPVCGLVSGYNDTEPRWSLPSDLMRQVLSKSLTIRGFIVFEFWVQQFDRFQAEVGEWIREGKVRYREDVVDGFETIPDAFRGLLRGENFGKLIVRVSD
ncbi:MAG TPA: NADP-dependent oxidoreductase [Mycobacterium sp.]|nr:NADP-dependent oxidoreductase [Mycobacterium sp.]